MVRFHSLIEVVPSSTRRFQKNKIVENIWIQSRVEGALESHDVLVCQALPDGQ